MTLVNAKTALGLVNQMKELAAKIQTYPQLVPVAGWIFEPVLKHRVGAPRTPRLQNRKRTPILQKKKRVLSAARRKELSRQAKARWAKAKKAGKNTIGAAD